MNKILDVNEKLAYAVVEPGVTFGDLYEYCVGHKLKLWPSTPSIGWGSIIGNVRGSEVPVVSQLINARLWIEVWVSCLQGHTMSILPAWR